MKLFLAYNLAKVSKNHFAVVHKLYVECIVQNRTKNLHLLLYSKYHLFHQKKMENDINFQSRSDSITLNNLFWLITLMRRSDASQCYKAALHSVTNPKQNVWQICRLTSIKEANICNVQTFLWILQLLWQLSLLGLDFISFPYRWRIAVGEMNDTFDIFEFNDKKHGLIFRQSEYKIRINFQLQKPVYSIGFNLTFNR